MSIVLDGTAGVTFANSSISTVGGVGDSQTWQNLTSSRALGTTYTNSTGKPIFLAIGAVGVVAIAQLNINGINCGQVGTSGGVRAPLYGIVPNGATYSVSAASGTPTIESWAELR